MSSSRNWFVGVAALASVTTPRGPGTVEILALAAACLAAILSPMAAIARGLGPMKTMPAFPSARGVTAPEIRHWRPAQIAAGIEPIRRVRPAPDLRHLRAPRRHLDLRPVAIHERESRDDRPPLGHLVHDGRDRAVALLDAYAHDSAAWTSTGRRRRTRKAARRKRLQHR